MKEPGRNVRAAGPTALSCELNYQTFDLTHRGPRLASLAYLFKIFWMRKRVLVELSGGVDSSVATALLQAQGYEVIAVSFQVGPNLKAFEIAREVASQLGIEHKILDLRGPFEELVIKDLCAQYAEGRTPNPCIRCNRYIKFGLILEMACELRAYLATGHYARVSYHRERARFGLSRARDRTRDQSYFLSTLSQHQLARLILPLGDLEYKEVRQIAQRLGLPSLNLPPSQDACFVQDGYQELLKSWVPEALQPGPIKDLDEKVLGQHQGIGRYTIGQRKGLGISLGTPRYVIGIDPRTRTVTVGERSAGYGTELRGSGLNLIAQAEIAGPTRVLAQIRHQMTPAPGWLEPLSHSEFRFRFDEPQWAITPGQTLVCYLGDEVLGGGVIEEQLS